MSHTLLEHSEIGRFRRIQSPIVFSFVLLLGTLLWAGESPADEPFLNAFFPNDSQLNRRCLGTGVIGIPCGNLGSDVSRSQGIALDDLDHDGHLDAVIANFNKKNEVCLGDGLGNFTCLSVSTDVYPSAGVALGLVDSDSHLDAVFVNEFNNDLVCFGNGAGGFTDCDDVSPDAYSGAGVALADMDKDGKLDAIFANSSRQNNRICLGTGIDAERFACDKVSEDGISSMGVAIGDLNNDQKLDAVFANTSNRRNRICLGNGVGGFLLPCQDVSLDAFSSTAVALGKVNGDNNLDAVFSNSAAENRVCLGNGAGGFFPCDKVNSNVFPSNGVALGDVDGDGDLDAVFANYGQKNQVCIGSGTGSFDCSDVSSDALKSTGVALGYLNPNSPPELMPIDDETMEELTSLTVALSATDPDGDDLSYSATDLPSFATPTDNGDGTASILFKPQIGDTGSYEITVIVTDSGTPQESDSQSFTLTVTENLVIPAIIVPAIIGPMLLD